MSSKIRITIYVFLLAILILFLGNISDALVLETIIILVIELLHNIKSRVVLVDSQTTNTIGDVQLKKCKYCMSEIDSTAKVCPICKRNQSNANNPLLLIPICIIIGIFLYCFFSPNAPISVRTILCELGIRSGYPYCSSGEYRIEFSGIDYQSY